MPPFETMDRPHDAVLWESTGVTDDYGELIVSSPVEIKVRWNWKRSQTVNARGIPIATDAQVVAAQDIALGSEMWKGTLEDWYATGSAGDNADILYVATEGNVDDLKGRITRREYGLSRFRDNPLPTG